MLPEYKFSDEEIEKRFMGFYGDDRVFADGIVPSLREKLSSLSEFVREIKVGFARYYNRRHNRRGYFWGNRFKSVIVEKGETRFKHLFYSRHEKKRRPIRGLEGMYSLSVNPILDL
jgi:hypothetical protein